MSSRYKYGPNLQVIGITGGIGSGKSTVLEVLARRGLVAVKADDIAHKVMLPGMPAHRRIVEHFGDEILSRDGTVNRDRLASIVFADADELAVLNRIVHPPVVEGMRSCFEETAASSEKVIVAVEIPLLVEAGLTDMVDAVVLVTAPRDVRLARMVALGWSRDRVLAIMKAQSAEAEKAKYADVIIDNNGTSEELEDRVDRALSQLAEGARE